MTTTGQRLFCAGSLLTAALAGVLVLHLANVPTATEENYQRIDRGMRLPDVEALLGRPSGDRAPAINYLFFCSNVGTIHEEFAAFERTDEALNWSDGGGSITIAFRPDGIITSKRYDAPAEVPLAQRVRRWLGL